MVSLLSETESVPFPGVAMALQLADRSTYRHGQRVGLLAAFLGAWMGLSGEALHQLRVAAALHDIGKLAVPTGILQKSSPFGINEYRIMQRHAPFGAFLLECTKLRSAISHVALHHHERWDGLGYPHGLCRTAIPLAAQITCVADAYEAMVTDRPYRVAPGHDFAVEEIRRSRGSQFSPTVVDAFVETEPSWREELES